MFFDSNSFWFLMGMIFILVAAGFRAYAKDRGWVITWWKAVVGLLAYGTFMLSFYAWGTLSGENEGSAGIKLMGLGLLCSLILGACFLMLIAPKKQIGD